MTAINRFLQFLSARPALQTALFLGILTVVVLGLFAPSLHSGFVYDSRAQVYIGDFIHQRDNLLPVLSFQVMRMDVLDFNRPVQLASLMFDSLIWGKNPFGYHLTNVVLHLIATGLTFLLLRHVLSTGSSTGPDLWRNFSAFLGTLLFAVHPLVTEAVCEPSNRKDILAAIFGFTALLVLIRHRSSTRQGDALRLLLCFLLTLLSIGTKEVGVAFPVVIFLYWFLFRRAESRLFWIGAIVGSATVVLLFLIARFALAHHPSEIFLVPPTYPGGSLEGALLIQPRILALYVIHVLWPTNLIADYGLNSLDDFLLLLSLFLLIVVGSALAWWSCRDRRAFFATGIIVSALLPVCNLVPIYRPAADRYLYIPLIGVALLVAIALDNRWLSRKSYRRVLAAIFALVVAMPLVLLTRQREWVWSTSLNLWNDTLERNPRSFDAIVDLPVFLMEAGRLDEAKARYEYALGTPYGQWPWLWAGYAIVLNRLGDRPHAESAARQAVALKPDILDIERMVRTMQSERDFEEEFIPIAIAAQKSSTKAP